MYNDFNYERFINSDELRNTTQYVVKQGDSIYTIAKKYDVSVNDLIALNKLASTMVYPNQVIFIPTKKMHVQPHQHGHQGQHQHGGHHGQTHNPQHTKSHVIMPGDTIRSLRHKFGDKYDYEILRVEPNQVLVLKHKMPREIVVSDDMNLNNVLTRNNLTADEFLRLNENNIFRVGNKIIT